MSQVKYCPRCKTAAALSDQACSQCGRIFKTQFAPPPDDRTMLGPAGMTAPPTVAPVATYAPTVASGGPLDDAERNVSMVWTAIGLTIVVVWVLVQLSSVVRLFFSDLKSYGAYALIGLLLPAFLLSFLTMRFRRLYLAAPGYVSPLEIRTRRAQFSVWASIGIFLLIIVGVGMSVWQIQEEEQKVRQAAEAVAKQKVDEEQRKNEYRRLSQPPPSYYTPARPITPPAYRTPTTLPSPDDRPSASRPFRPRVDPRTLVRRPSQAPVSWDPNMLPCGHRFSRFETSRGREVGVCEQGHHARIINMRWVPVPGE